ncbi:MAG: hypothetical protein ABEJ57_08645 [Halobacteriaceae archaeon]
MQRRAAAAAAVVFLLVAAGAYAYLGVTAKPPIQTEVAAEASAGETVTLGGKSYTVTELSATAGGQASLKWFNDSVRFTETIPNASNVSYQTDIPETDWDDAGLTYRVTIPNTSEASPATFTELQTTNRTTYTENGARYVIVDRDGDGTKEAVPFTEYFGEPHSFTVEVGDRLTYQNNTTTVTSMSTSELVLAWRAPSNVTGRVGAGGNITLPTGTYLAYFQDTDPGSEGPEVVVFTQDFDGYQASLDHREYWTERMKGLWGVVAIGLITGIGLLGMAYLPSRY